MRPIIRSPMYVSTSKLCPRTASTPAPDGGATASGRSSPRIAMHSLQGSRWVRLILGTVAVAACIREAPNREGEAKGGAIVPSHFTQLTMVHDRLWVTTDAGIVVIEPVAEKWRSEEHTSELQSHVNLVCRLLLEKKKKTHFPLASQTKKNKKTNTN